MKKKLSLTIVSLMCLGVFGLTACNDTSSTSSIADSTSVTDSTSAVDTTSEVDSEKDTSVVAETVYESIAISNKTELTASWKEEEADRELDLTIDPVANINVLLKDEMLTVTSSDTSVVTATGIKLHAAGAGTATITVTLTSGGKTVTDSVDLTIEAVAAPISLQAAREVAKGELVKTRGYVTSIIEDSRYCTIADGDYAIELYYVDDVIGDIAVGDMVLVKGTSSPYDGLMEIGSITSLEKIDASENTDVAMPNDLVITDWNAIPDGSDSRIVTIEGMKLTSLPADYDVDSTEATRFAFGVTLNGVEVTTSVDYHAGDANCDAIYNKLASVPLTSTVDFHGLLTVYSNNYQISPMTADDITVTAAELTAEESLANLRTTLGDLDYSEGTYEVATLPLADTLGMYTVSYEVSTELAALVTVDAETGKVTVMDTDTATTGTITASIYDGDSNMVGETVVIDVTIKAVLVEPDAMAGKTLADLTAVEAADYKMMKYTGVTGVVSNLKDGNGSAYGNFDVAADAAGTDKFAVYGATATLGAIKFDNHDGSYYFSNPKDFMSNELTGAIKADDTITFNAIRYAYNDVAQVSIEITAINGVEIVEEEPVEEEAFLTYDFSSQTQEASSPAWNAVDETSFKTVLDTINTDASQASLLSISDVAKSYVGHENNANFDGLKMGNSTTDGTFTLNFAEGTNVSKVVVNGIGWNSKVNTLTVGDAETQTFVNAGDWDAEDAYSTQADYTFDITDADSITFSGRRVLISSISIFTAQ